jgi:RNA polymerase sigma-70 factor, ECF subfamily
MEEFETYRIYLFSVAYRMLGSAMDAEDMVQETYLRYQATPSGVIHSLKAYLVTILTRLCVDQLQLARRTREEYIGPWLPEPIRTDLHSEADDPAMHIEQEESISLAFLVMLERLQPFERATFLLHDIFGYGFTEIAEILGKNEAACRRSNSRARHHLQGHRPRFTASHEVHQRLLSGYFQAVETGEMQNLMNLLAEDVILWTDSGGKTRTAAFRPIDGRDAVARFIMGTRRFWPEEYQAKYAEINGQPALLICTGEHVFCVITLDVDGEQIHTIRVLANPEKLASI